MKIKGLYTGLMLMAAICVLCSFVLLQQPKPTIYIIGDSTVKNGHDDGQNKGAHGQWGWGHYLGQYFDLNRVTVENDALGGTSSRTFMTNPKLWPTVLAKIKAGDFLILQFGHNDGGAINDTIRARATFKGVGDSSVSIHNMLTHQDEVVHSYGWYIRKYITDAKAKGATVIVCSPIPRDSWKNGKINRNDDNYGLWAKQAAQQAGASFLPLNTIISDDYDIEGQDKVMSTYFEQGEATHTNEAGAMFNTTAVVKGIKALTDSNLKVYLK